MYSISQDTYIPFSKWSAYCKFIDLFPLFLFSCFFALGIIIILDAEAYQESSCKN